MRIGIDGSRMNMPEPTGVERFSDALIPPLAHEAAESGHTPIVYLRSPVSSIPSISQRVIHRTKLWTHTGLGPRAIRDNVDVLVVPSHVLPIIRPKRCAVYLHDGCFEEFGRAYPIITRWYLRLTSAHAVRTAGVFTHTDHTRDMFVRLYGSGAFPINVVPPASFPQPHDAATTMFRSYRYFLVISRIEAKKNIPVLLRAYDKLIDGDSNFRQRLIIMGPNGYESHMVHACHQSLRNHERVEILPYTDEAAKHAALYGSDGVIHPALCEGWGFVLSEARTAGKPFAASDIPACRVSGGGNGIYVSPPNSITAWSDAIRRLSHAPVTPEPHQDRTWNMVARECVRGLEGWYG